MLSITILLLVALLLLGGWLLWQRQKRRSEWREDALKHLFDSEYHGRLATIYSTAGALRARPDDTAGLLSEMQASGQVLPDGDAWRLTDAGRDEALRVIRAHRLWERYLADRTGHRPTEWHRHSERQEHRLTPEQADALAADLGHPRFDPHGDPIPTAEGHLAPASTRLTLLDLDLDQPARILHVEDEPAALYAELAAAHIYVGMEVRLLDVTAERVHFGVDGSDVTVTPVAAANIAVALLAPGEGLASDAEPLSGLEIGESGRVVRISPRCQGLERRRFLDLGILPGTLVKAEMVSPSGDPTAYRIRGALIGLRREQAEMIQIVRNHYRAQHHRQQLETAL